MKFTLATKGNSAEVLQELFYLKDQLCELSAWCLFTSKSGKAGGVHYDRADVGWSPVILTWIQQYSSLPAVWGLHLTWGVHRCQDTNCAVFSAFTFTAVHFCKNLLFSFKKCDNSVSVTASQPCISFWYRKRQNTGIDRLSYILAYFISYSIQSDLFCNSRACTYYSNFYA